jgi:hypothetical protein
MGYLFSSNATSEYQTKQCCWSVDIISIIERSPLVTDGTTGLNKIRTTLVRNIFADLFHVDHEYESCSSAQPATPQGDCCVVGK